MNDGIKIGHYDLDDDIVESAKRDKIYKIKVYRPIHEMVVLGRGSKPELELNMERCITDDVLTLKRKGGGCAVFLDPGNVIFSMAVPVSGIGGNSRYFKIISEFLIQILGEVGVKNVCHGGISDLVMGDRKVAGACIYRTKGFLFYSATLLASPRIELMEKYLAHPPKEPKYRRGRAHKNFVTSIRGTGDFDYAEELQNNLRERLIAHISRAIFLQEFGGKNDASFRNLEEQRFGSVWC